MKMKRYRIESSFILILPDPGGANVVMEELRRKFRSFLGPDMNANLTCKILKREKSLSSNTRESKGGRDK